jgi:uncharacterized protein (DUF433 family)
MNPWYFASGKQLRQIGMSLNQIPTFLLIHLNRDYFITLIATIFYTMIAYREYITIDAGKRSGKACIRGMRISVADVLGYLAAGMSHEDILSDFPELTNNDILACLAYAADAEKKYIIAAA